MMTEKKIVLVIIGSASKNSANQKLANYLLGLMKDDFSFAVYNDLKVLPHFDPELSIEESPKPIVAFRDSIDKADGVLICTPEYVFSIPSGLKNAIEWCVSTTVFSDKPVGLITASADGRKGHEELQLILKTVMAKFTDETALLIRGVKGKLNEKGEIIDHELRKHLTTFAQKFTSVIKNGYR